MTTLKEATPLQLRKLVDEIGELDRDIKELQAGMAAKKQVLFQALERSGKKRMAFGGQLYDAATYIQDVATVDYKMVIANLAAAYHIPSAVEMNEIVANTRVSRRPGLRLSPAGTAKFDPSAV